MIPVTTDDPAVGYIPNHPDVDSLTIVLRSGKHHVVPCDPVKAVEMGYPHSDDCTITLKSGRVISKDREQFKTEEVLWIGSGHFRNMKTVCSTK